jgi:hypothetical protein
MRKAWYVLGVVWLVPNLAAAAPILITRQSGLSQVEINGLLVEESADAQTDGRVSVFVIRGAPGATQARTAARSSASEIAANAVIEDHLFFSGTVFSNVLSQASYNLALSPDNLFVNRASLDFVLPEAYMEIRSNAEAPFAFLSAVLIADLRVCFATACSSSDSQFNFQADMEGSWRNFTWSATANGNPSLDLDPMRNPTIVDTGASGFIRTTTITFPTFFGHLDLGDVSIGSPLTIEYLVQTRALGQVLGTSAIAAINDPFVLDTDPVQAFAPVTLTLTPQAPAPPATAPEPATWWLIASGLAVCARRRRRAL